MTYYIYHWNYGAAVAPVPEAILQPLANGDGIVGEVWTVEVESIHEFVKKHGAIQLLPPCNDWPHWSIYVSNNGRFNQR